MPWKPYLSVLMSSILVSWLGVASRYFIASCVNPNHTHTHSGWCQNMLHCWFTFDSGCFEADIPEMGSLQYRCLDGGQKCLQTCVQKIHSQGYSSNHKSVWKGNEMKQTCTISTRTCLSCCLRFEIKTILLLIPSQSPISCNSLTISTATLHRDNSIQKWGHGKRGKCCME